MAWILQGNPNRFDIDGYLPNSPFIYWRAPRQQGEFSVGDRAPALVAWHHQPAVGWGPTSHLLVGRSCARDARRCLGGEY